ncbi:MAG TPA: non-ribosomal peptide synthase/polyketide synthase, partial [Longimicrobium sp.]|nr:non-ribosomal peptide synthase/polyketide synthase [Longimicrobium sp.]
PGVTPGGGDAAGAAQQAAAKFDLSLTLGEAGGFIVGGVTYATALFEQATIERHLAYLRRVLEAMVADDLQAVDTLPLLPEDERRRVLEEWNATDVAYPRDLCIHELFEAQVERTPTETALVFEGEELTYTELNARANRLAHHLRSLGVGPEARVGICVERGPEMVVGMLAVLKAGGAYLPLDPAYPEERLRYTLEDGAPVALLTEPALRPLFSETPLPVVELGASGAAWDERPATNPARGGLTPDHLAYVIYTSGSTGRPKGVRVPHRSVAATLAVAGDAFGFGAGDRVPSLASFAFDIWLFETILPLLGGGTVRLVPRDRVLDVPALVEDLTSCTALHAVPALMRRIVEEVRARPEGVLRSLRHAFVGGDAVAPDLLEEMRVAFPAAGIHVLYGPTEAAIICASHRLGDEAAARQMVGRPLGNASLYVVERGGSVAPAGVPGELCLGGASVARDYLGRPGLTAERFVPDPFSAEPGARLYRTGDRVRWLADGSLEFLGRTDRQVKVRGFRIEPGEIEARLREHPEVREAVVLAREDAPGDRRLVAYLVGPESVAIDALRTHLSERLPEYMVPAAYVRLEALSLTPTGKVDRKALPAPEGGAFVTRGYEAPVGETEEALAGVWSELLRVEQVGRRDHFFELGGHSLLAVRVISRVRQVLGAEVGIADLFERPVLADLARAIESAARTELPPIEPVDRSAPIPLSFAQQRLWFLEQIGDLGSAYHMSTRLRLGGELNWAALRRTLDAILERHEALRTTFGMVDGEPVQRIAEESRFHLVEHDLEGHPDAAAELRRLAAEEAGAPFDLEQGPLIRGRLIRLAADDHALLITMHHIVSDGWSMGVLTRELGTLYDAFRRGEANPLPPLPVQYADYAAWQRKWVAGEVLRQQADYWKETLSGAPELLELPADHPRPARQSHAGAAAALELDEELTAGLKALGRRHGTTLFMTLFAGWATVLARLSGKLDVVVGTPSANRGQAEIEGLIGFFVNTLALRVDLSGSPTVAEVLGQVKQRALEAQQNQDIPFEQVVELVQPVRSLAHTPLFQVMFTLQNTSDGSGMSLPAPEAGGTGGAGAESPQVEAKFDLSLSLFEAGSRIVGGLTYATALFERATVERFLGYLRRVLEEMAADDSRRVERLPLLPDAERHQVVEEWNATDAAFPSEVCIHELFEAQTGRTPNAVAVVHDSERVTYAQLNARANQLAHQLRALGVGPDTRVAICVHRGVEMMVGLLAIMKAGGAYVPLDPAYPAERLTWMIADSAPVVLLTHGSLAELFDGMDVRVIDLVADAGTWAGQAETNPGRASIGLTPDHLAYVIYTSGSTGQPKGVMVEHRSLANLVAWHCAAFGVKAGDRSSSVAGFGFDATTWEVWPPLSAGAALLLPGTRDPQALLEWWEEQTLDVSFLPTPLAEVAFARGRSSPGLRTLLIGGDRLRSIPAEPLPFTLVNNYGPTETTVVATSGAIGASAKVHIGRPIANTRVYLLDQAGEPVPVGVAGELYIGGAGVARGYQHRPGLTAERFVPDPFAGAAGARLYRTGDLARWLADGTIEFLGRTDFQVKIRGFRIELGEIEARLAEHPSVRDAVVLVRQDASGDGRLVAYYLGEALEAETLRAHLAERLPGYMVPAAFVWMEAYPLTPNGKVDRKALPAPDDDAFAAREYEAPVGETERALAEVWSELLGVERVGRQDNFFDLGGHSLLAVRVISRVRQVLGAEVGIADLFERPALADFARGVQQAARVELPPIQPVARTAPLPLSFAQQRLWFLERMGDLGGTYHIHTRLRLGRELDRAALRRALDAIVARHEALRTTFVEVEGEPVQRIAPAEESPFHLVEHDLREHADAAAELRLLSAEEAGAPFDFEQGPLIRGRLVRLPEDDHVLLLTMHHIVSDGWSMEVLTRELATLYEAFRRGEENPLPPLPIQYADYAAWQRQWVDGEVLREQTAYWRAALTGAPELLELPADHPRPARQSHDGALAGVELDEAVTAGLRSLSRRHGTTLFMTVLAGWAAVLGRLSGQQDVVVGTPSANRGRAEIEGLIGFFVNTLALRVDLAGSPTVAELLGRVKERVLGAQENQDIPFEQVVELVQPVRSMAHTPLFQVMLSWQNASGDRPELPAARPGDVGSASSSSSPSEASAASVSEAAAKFDLSLALGEAGGRIGGSITYATSLFEHSTVERHLAYLGRVLEAFAADDLQSVDALPLLPEAERRLVVEEWNATGAAYPSELCIHELVEAQVARAPEAVAVVFEGGELTYAELNAHANRLAHHLRDLGVRPDARVAICVERGPAMVVGLLAILKAGGGYVPLDPGYPVERLRYMLHDSAPAAVLTQGSLEGVEALFADVDVPVIDLEGAEWADRPATDPERAGLTAAHLAYVIYTSGSTGMPKGVMIGHRSLANHTAWQAGAFGLGPDDTVLQRTSISFDASVWELWTTLATGARLHLLPPAAAKDPAAIGRAVVEGGVTVAQFVPTLLQAVLAALPAGGSLPCRILCCGGEPLSAALVDEARAAGAGRVVNLYGPTEATIDSTWDVFGSAVDGRVPAIGRPIANARIYVLDARGEPVPVGVAGELYVGGAGLARGYLGRAGLTAERFVPDPFSTDGGARMYRTGDLGRWRADGTLEFLGRTDFQVKLRGYRIELGEIEAALRGHEAVRDAVVLAREDVPGNRRLVAYVVGTDSVEVDALRAHLSARLPEYMVPAAYVRLDALPLTPGAKLDRRALPAPGADAFAQRTREEPLDGIEAAMAEIWSELLGVERVGRWDNFFELGGHSLLAVRVISRVRQLLEVEVSLGELFTRPVLADFARELESRSRAELPPIELADRRADLPLSFAQQRLWFIDQLEGAGAAYHMPTRMRLQGELDQDALVRALDRIVARHEALRTTFVQTDGDPVQRIAPAEASAFHLVEHDLRGRDDAGAELGRVMAEEAGARFDLAHGPLIRGRLVRMADDDHVLLITMHHIVSDGWSMGVLTDEISTLYAAFRAGEPDPLPPLPVQYADYAAWQRKWVEGEVLQAQADYWTRTLSGAPELLELPTDHPRPARQDFAGSGVGFGLDAELTAGLKALSRRHGTTLFMTLMAGWAAVLSRLSGQDDVVVGTPSANRGRPEIEGLIGFFVNTLALRVDLSGSPAVPEALARVKARALEAQANQDIPFEQVVELVQPARSLAHSPLFQVMFVWQNAPRGELELSGLAQAPLAPAPLPGSAPAPMSGPMSGPASGSASGREPEGTAKFDLMLALGEVGGRIVGALEYATSLFEEATVDRWLGYLGRVLQAMAADDGSSVERLPMLSDGERALVLREWNATEAAYPRQACVHELVEDQVARTPGSVAVVFEGERVLYAELNARANRLAHHLRALGVAPDVRVGICVERSVEMVVGLLGILKAGGAYVPLDSSYPVDRLRNMVEDSAPAVLLTHPPQAGTAAALAAGSDIPVLDLSYDEAWAERPDTNPGREGLGPRNLAHVLFTSGSTGRPKGVMLEHGSLVNRLQWMQDRYGMTPDEALLQKTPFSFDVSFWEFFWPLMMGARLVMARPGGHRDPAYLVETIQREGITVAHFVPSMLQLFLEHPDAALCAGLLRVPVSGEAVSAGLARQFHQRLPGVELTNQYGPTESGEVTEWECAPGLLRISIGRAIHNSTVYVLDRVGQPVPVGVAGELFIGGIAVARGYLGRPRLTAERLVPDPFGEPGARMYRTGDLCRWLPDGTVEYLGRSDFQVKVRGFRVELGEIEARLASHPGVREAVVLALDDAAGGKRLVAYLVGEEVESEALRVHLSEQLPDYMVPAAFVRLESLPLNPNGKLDRKALPAPDADAFDTGAYEAPVGEMEEMLAGIWSELLKVEQVGRRDDFFRLGGHSLLAVRVISRVRQVLGVEAAIGDLFVRPVLADFARGLEAASRAELPPIEQVERGMDLPLSFAQQRLWFLERLGSAGAAYHITTHMPLRGEMDRPALRRALDRIVARHEALRTTFAEVDGQPVQRIVPVEESAFHLVEQDLRGHLQAGAELRRVMEEARAPFDLARGPLIRGHLIQLADDDHLLLITMHHIVSDGWSLGVLTRELGALYAAFRAGHPDPLPALPIQYADYAVWQRKWVDGEVLQAQAEYWTRTLAGAPELLELPADHARPARQEFTGGVVGIELYPGLTAGLKALSQRHGATLFMTLLAGWAAVLSRLSGQDDVVVGTPTANRGRSEIEGLIGFFINTLALRVDLSGAPSVADVLARVRERSLGAQHHQDIPFEQVVELLQPVRSLAHTPLFQVMFIWQNAPERELELPGLAAPAPAAQPPSASRPEAPSQPEAASQTSTAKFDLSLALSEHDGRIVGAVEYATALFERETVERWVGYLGRVLEAMAADDTRPVDALELLPDDEWRQVVEAWNATEVAYPADVCIHELFEEQAGRAPNAVAVVFEDQRLTYAELNRRANRLAHELQARGVGPDVRVGLYLERGLEMVVGLLAVLKAGGTYVPLDPDYPAERIGYMLADSRPAVVLAQRSVAGLPDGLEVPVLALDGDEPAWAGRPETNPARAGLTPEHLAYVIYTSGSTGAPKGVMNAHRGVVNRLLWMQDAYALGAGDAVLQKTTYGFDVSVWEFFWTLATGARLVMARPGGHRDPVYLAETIRREGVTTVHFVPSMLQLFVEEPGAEACTGLRRVVCSGEALPAALAGRFQERLPGVELHNLYGPTEAAVDVTAWRCEPADAAKLRVPLGRPIANTRLYVLDGAGAPVPVGVAGELYIGGVQVARGYHARPGLTAERFVPDAFGGQPGARLYRTGDLCRWRADGTLEYLGRNDFQVKVRGFRIELGEIEARLLEHPGVREAVVLARDDASGDLRLVAYHVGEAVEADALRAHLSARLPEHMVPAAFVRLEALPLTPNGKLDRRALPAPDAGAIAARAYEAPLGDTEIALAEIWSELLGVERVGRWDNFFALGGHSLRAVQVVSRVRQALGVEAALGDLFLRPVLADFARGLETASRAELPPIEPVERGTDLPLSFAQQRLWFIDQLEGAGAAYHIPTRQRLRGELDRGALRRALDRIVARHEALRTTFAEVNGEPVQRIAPAEANAFHLVEHDLRGHPQAGAELRRVMDEEAGAPFDLARGPLIRGRLIQLADDDHLLLITMHHIVSDGWSMEVFTRELGALYAAFRDGEPDPLPALPIQYADYAAWQRKWVDGEVLQAQAQYWTETLGGAPELLELPTDHARPARQDFTGGVVGIQLDAELTARLKALSQRHGATLFMTLQAGWAAVLSRLSGQDHVVVGTPTANRGRSEIEGLIGFFVNTLALRVDLSGSPTVADVLARVKERSLGAQHHQDIPFEQVVELLQPVRSLSHTPLFQVMFTWQNAPERELELPGVALAAPRPAPAAQAEAALQTTAKFDLSLALSERNGWIVGGVEYAAALFERATIERWVGYLQRALEAMVADESQSVARLPLLPEEERRLVLEDWNATARPYPTGGLRVHDLFRAQAARTPHAVALSWHGERLTYAQLEARANQIANALRRRGVGPEVRVGICLPRTLDLVAAMLGVLGAGGAYVPLDPAYPRERLGYMTEDAAITLVITDSALADRLPEGAATLLLDRDAIAAESADAPESGVLPENLSHVIFTSGSTGRPKGVMIRHSSVVVLLHWLRENVTDEERSAVLFSTSINFDVSIAEIFGTLAWGGKLVLVENALELAELEEEVVYASMVPSAAAELLRSGGIPASVKTLNLGGEALPNALTQGLYGLETVEKVGNLYGPTEDTTYSTYYLVPRGADQVLVGTPVANTQAYVLDQHLQPVPVGVVGELYLAGDGLSRGYANRPAMSAERFLPCPFGAPGARMYRVMDRVRRLSDGQLEYLGRTDFQVKVRGYRIELGEIEARLAEHPALRAPVVLVREDVPGDRRLVAYYLGDEPVAVEALKAHLAERVPGYMVPEAYVWMEAYPLTPNGKVDRKALPAPEGDAYGTREYEAPLGDTEAALAGVWAEVLGVDRVGRRDNFFELGGHSLLAVRVISRVRQALGVEAAIGDLFVRPVLADFARGLETAARAELPAIEPVERGTDLPLSFAQQRLWFIDQLEGAGTAYHIPTRQRLRGELDGGALRRALDRIVARHEALRTTFAEVDGEAVQRIAPAEASPFQLIEHDLRDDPQGGAELRRVMAEEAEAPFDLARGPLIRGRLVRMADDDHVLLITMHHIVSDGWSMEVFTRELGALYAAFQAGEPDPLPPLPIQYADYAVWQRKWVDGEVLQAQAEYWTETLGGAPELLELPTDFVRPARQDFSGGVVGIELDAELTAGVKALSQRYGATPFMTLLAGWAAVLSRLSGQDDVMVGTPTANRGRSEIEGLIGFFVNTLALRVDFSGAATVADVLGRVKARALEAQANQDIPFEQVVELLQPVRSLSHTPLFQVMFAWQNAPERGLELPGVAPASGGAAPRQGPAAQTMAKFDLSLTLTERDGRIVGAADYAAALFERATVERWLGYLRRVLEAMVADESQSVARLPLLDEAERRLVVEEWNATAAADPGEPFAHALFEAQARRTPGAAALVFEGETLSYAELNARANRLAHHLRTLGVGPDARVAICVGGPAMVVGALAVLKAGGAYLPLDPEYPGERLRYMLEDGAPVAVLTGSALLGLFEGVNVPVLDLEAPHPAWANEPESDPERGALSPAHLAYVIYTSGSTGRPKGVRVTHSGLSATMAAAQRAFGFGADDRVPSLASFAFDIWIFETLLPLLGGGTVLMVPRDRVPDVPRLVDDLSACTNLHAVPALMRHIVEEVRARPGGVLPSLRRAFVGGDAVAPDLLEEMREAFPAAEISVLYGPTEATIICASHRLGSEPAARRMLGLPLGNAALYVLDAAGQVAPVGVAGELCLGGASVARDYLGRPGLTADRFVPDPFAAEPGARLYRTGDRVRWLASGELEFLGRTDGQVKVRGYRIELGEIEARLAEHPAVRESLVLAREDAPGDKRLVAYVVGDDTVGAEVLRAHLGETLPDYMVPAAYVRLEQWPLTPNGKVDRKALPAPEGDAYAAGEYTAPVGDTEEALAAIWAQVLGVERVGRHDNFFELGGHSLLAVRVISRMRQVLGAEASLAHLFSHPTVESLAARVSGSEPRVRNDRAIAIRPAGSQPPLFLVHEGAGSIAYAQVLNPHAGGDIPVYALPAAPADASLRTMEGMATRLVRMIREVQPSGPYRVAGWSFGGVLSYEVAAQLIGGGETVEFVGMFDSYHPVRARAVADDAVQEHGLILHALRAADTTADGGGAGSGMETAAAGDEDLEAFVARCRENGLLPRHVTVAQA